MAVANLKLGSSTPVALQVGAVTAMKAYLGATLVWDATGAAWGADQSMFATQVNTSSGPGGYSLGVRVRILRAGRITHIHVYRVAADTVTTTRPVYIWPEAGGAFLVKANTVETPNTAGWVSTALVPPLLVTVDLDVRIAYDSPAGSVYGTMPPTTPNAAPDLLLASPYTSCWGVVGSFPVNLDAANYMADVTYQPAL